MKLLIIDHKARSTRGMPIHQVANADLIVGRDRKVLKSRSGDQGYTVTARELASLRKTAKEVIERGEPLL